MVDCCAISKEQVTNLPTVKNVYVFAILFFGLA